MKFLLMTLVLIFTMHTQAQSILDIHSASKQLKKNINLEKVSRATKNVMVIGSTVAAVGVVGVSPLALVPAGVIGFGAAYPDLQRDKSIRLLNAANKYATNGELSKGEVNLSKKAHRIFNKKSKLDMPYEEFMVIVNNANQTNSIELQEGAYIPGLRNLLKRIANSINPSSKDNETNNEDSLETSSENNEQSFQSDLK